MLRSRKCGIHFIHTYQVGKASHMRHITDIAEASRNSRSFTQDAMAAMAGPSGVQPEGATGAEFSSPEQMLSEIRCRIFFSGCQVCKVYVESGSTVVPSLLMVYVLNRFEIIV